MESFMWIVWLSLLIITLVLEASGPALISIWFSAGSLVCLGLSFIPGFPFWVEIIIFLAVSLLTFLLIRPHLRQIMKKGIVRTNIDTYIGSRGVMTIGADDLNPGAVALRGATWTAIPAQAGVSLRKGDKVIIVAIEGNKLLVEPAKKEN